MPIRGQEGQAGQELGKTIPQYHIIMTSYMLSGIVSFYKRIVNLSVYPKLQAVINLDFLEVYFWLVMERIL